MSNSIYTKKYIVYETTNLINGKYYIGVHRKNGKNYLGSGKILIYAIKKYGRDNFMREILRKFDNKKDAYDYEIEIITKKLINNSNCYNLSAGGKGNDKGIGILSGEYHHQFGKVHSQETKNKISKSLMGNIAYNKGKCGKNSPNSKLWFIYGHLFYSLKEATNFFEVSRTTIQRWCLSKSKYHIPLCYSIKQKRYL